MTATDGVPEGGPEQRLPDEVVEGLFEDDGCRRVLSCLADHDGPMPVEDLARALAARETGVDDTAVDDEKVAQRREDVFQELLPKLTPTGVVAYDSLLGTVELTTTDDRIRSRL